LIYPGETAKDGINTIPVAESFAAKIPYAHGQVIKLKDGSICILTNEHVKPQIPNSVEKTTSLIPDITAESRYKADFDLRLVQVGNTTKFNCDQVFAQQIHFENNFQLADFLEKKPELNLQTSLLYNPESNKIPNTKDNNLISNKNIESYPIQNYTLEPNLNLLFYSLPANQSTFNGSSASPIYSEQNGKQIMVASHSSNYPNFNPKVYDEFLKKGTGEQLVRSILNENKRINSGVMMMESENHDSEVFSPHAVQFETMLAAAIDKHPEILQSIRNKDKMAIFDILYGQNIEAVLKSAERNGVFTAKNISTETLAKNPNILSEIQKTANKYSMTAEFFKDNQQKLRQRFKNNQALLVAVPVTKDNINAINKFDTEEK